MKIVTEFVADDGRHFEKEGECLAYESSIEFRDIMLPSKLKAYSDMLDDDSPFEEVATSAIIELWPRLKEFMPRFESQNKKPRFESQNKKPIK